MFNIQTSNQPIDSTWIINLLDIEIRLLELPDDNEIRDKGLDTIHKLRNLIYDKQNMNYRACMEFNRLCNKYKLELENLINNKDLH